VENDAAREVEGYINGERLAGGKLRVAIGEKLIREPPFI
jgi:hypothetical protein